MIVTTPVNAQQWLTARPIAHRGLHERAKGVIENSLAAAKAAVAKSFAIECDVQISADGEAMVFHDDGLERLTAHRGRVDWLAAAQLNTIALKDGEGAIPTLDQLLDTIAARVPLVVEIKSHFNGDMRLAERTAQVIACRNAQICIKSFDPRIIAHLRREQARLAITHVPLGMVAEASYESSYWKNLTPAQKQEMQHFLHWQETRPDFLSWHVNDLPHVTPHLLRHGAGLPVMTWTVRTPEQFARASQWADQIVFEGWIPA